MHARCRAVTEWEPDGRVAVSRCPCAACASAAFHMIKGQNGYRWWMMGLMEMCHLTAFTDSRISA